MPSKPPEEHIISCSHPDCQSQRSIEGRVLPCGSRKFRSVLSLRHRMLSAVLQLSQYAAQVGVAWLTRCPSAPPCPSCTCPPCPASPPCPGCPGAPSPPRSGLSEPAGSTPSPGVPLAIVCILLLIASVIGCVVGVGGWHLAARVGALRRPHHRHGSGDGQAVGVGAVRRRPALASTASVGSFAAVGGESS